MDFRNRKITVPGYLHELHGENPWLYTLIATYLAGLIAGFLVLLNIGFGTLPVWKTAILFILYVDIAGGVVSNFSSATRQYYSKNEKIRILFILTHLLHPGLFLFVFPAAVRYFAFTGAFTVISCLILDKMNNTEEQQALALIFLVSGLIISFFFILPFNILYTFAPLFMIKLILGFSVRRTL